MLRFPSSNHPAQSIAKNRKLLLCGAFLILINLSQVASKNGGGAEFSSAEYSRDKKVYEQALFTFTHLNQSLSMTISPTYFEQKHLQTMWYVDYLKVRDESTYYQGLYDPQLRVVTVLEKGVYFKKLPKSWKDLSLEDKEGLTMDIFFELPVSLNITAAQIERNSSLVAVAYSNLTVEIFDMRKIQKKDQVTTGLGLYNYSSVHIDTSYRFGTEEDHRINSIGHIPASKFLVFSSNRFEILKVNRLTGEVVKRTKNPLDNIGLIEAPCLSHRVKADPYNPAKKMDPQISVKNQKLGLKTQFIATGAGDPMNAVIDWTIMKPIRFFSMHLLFIGAAKREESIINSIAYYGGVPEGNLYSITTHASSPFIFLYSGVYGRVMKEIDLGIRSKNKIATWIYATSYISVYFPEPQTDQGTPEIKLIVPHSPNFDFRTNYQLNRMQVRRVESFELSHQYLQLGKKTRANLEFWIEDIYEIDSLYLAVFKSGNSIKVEIPPINWDFCLPVPANITVDNEKDEFNTLYMLYGRMISCYVDQPLITPEGNESEDQGENREGSGGDGEGDGEGGDKNNSLGKRILEGEEDPESGEDPEGGNSPDKGGDTGNSKGSDAGGDTGNSKGSEHNGKGEGSKGSETNNGLPSPQAITTLETSVEVASSRSQFQPTERNFTMAKKAQSVKPTEPS